MKKSLPRQFGYSTEPSRKGEAPDWQSEDQVFLSGLEKEINTSIWNDYKDNYDHYRFGPAPRNAEVPQFFAWVLRALRLQSKGAMRVIAESEIAPHLKRLAKFHRLLSDAKSRDLLLRLIAYRLLGNNKVKLPLNSPQYWEGIESMKSCIERPDDTISLNFLNWQLSRFNLRSVGIPVEMYFTLKGIFTEFMLRQYEYHEGGVNIGVRAGDTVIDAGGCWGDTALLFAAQAGPKGEVHSFEFLPSNLAILRRNLSINQDLAKQIRVIERPLWDVSGRSVYYSENGPGSQVSFEKLAGGGQTVETISIDEYVAQEDLAKVDFIKMDIEGAEQPALRGASNTIRRFKPSLAIAIYHNLDDFSGVVELIDSMQLGYKFYLGHHSIHAEETILYAVCG